MTSVWCVVVIWFSVASACVHKIITRKSSCHAPQDAITLTHPKPIQNDTLVIWTTNNTNLWLFATEWKDGRCQEFSTDASMLNRMIRNSSNTCHTFRVPGDLDDRRTSQYIVQTLDTQTAYEHYLWVYREDNDQTQTIDTIQSHAKIEFDQIRSRFDALAKTNNHDQNNEDTLYDSRDLLAKICCMTSHLYIFDIERNPKCDTSNTANHHNIVQPISFLYGTINDNITVPCRWKVSLGSTIRWSYIGSTDTILTSIEVDQISSNFHTFLPQIGSPIYTARHLPLKMMNTKTDSRIHISANFSLTIVHITQQDSGVYMVEHLHPNYRTESQRFLVRVEGEDKHILSMDPDTVVARIGPLWRTPHVNELWMRQTKSIFPKSIIDLTVGTVHVSEAQYYWTRNIYENRSLIASIVPKDSDLNILIADTYMKDHRYHVLNKGQTLRITQTMLSDNGTYVGIALLPNGTRHQAIYEIIVKRQNDVPSTTPVSLSEYTPKTNYDIHECNVTLSSMDKLGCRTWCITTMCLGVLLLVLGIVGGLVVCVVRDSRVAIRISIRTMCRQWRGLSKCTSPHVFSETTETEHINKNNVLDTSTIG